LVVLLSVFVITVLYFFLTGRVVDYTFAGRISMGLMLLFTSSAHFAFKRGMVRMIPNFLPFKQLLVAVTGVLEIALGLALLFSVYNNITGWIIIGLLICMLPANINAAIHKIDYQKPDSIGPGLFYLWFRVPLQLFFIGWIYWSVLLR